MHFNVLFTVNYMPSVYIINRFWTLTSRFHLFKCEKFAYRIELKHMHLLFYVTVYHWTSAHIKQVIMCRFLKVWKHNIHTLLASLTQLTGKRESEVVNQTISDPKVKVGVATPPHNQARRCHTGFCANAANMQCTYSPLWAICSATLCWSNRYRPSAVHERRRAECG